MTEQAPYDAAGEPFPTTYYLTCPSLVAAVSRVEATGGVERWSAAVEADVRLGASLDRATAEQRSLRARLAHTEPRADGGASLGLGIGGAARPGGLKCLHAHVAWALARPGYALGDEILREVGSPWPAERCCVEPRLDCRASD